ncbi:hypothetical protein [Halorubrum aethiopicum]|uniref:hypothetical protein n=1 Tax=Halorubrum aethiopicum TaxID=1758255 RepID=UPI0008374BFA|nr:hypothetical protein [Halorubrum aethiopicum]
MSAPQRSGSAAYVIPIVALLSLLVGAMMLTFVVYPIYNGFTQSAAWSAQTEPGTRLLAVIAGIWEFWGAVILISILSYVWIRTRRRG